MSKKVISSVNFALSLFVLAIFVKNIFFTIGGDSIKPLVLGILFLIFIVLALIGGLQTEKKNMISGIFMILAAISIILLGLGANDSGVLGQIALIVAIISFILYLYTAIQTFRKK